MTVPHDLQRFRDLEDRTDAAHAKYGARPVLFGREVSPAIVEHLAERMLELDRDDADQAHDATLKADGPSKESDL